MLKVGIVQEKKWVADDCGCYAEGGFGRQHIRERLAGLVAASAQGRAEWGEVVEALQGEMSDDAWEEDAAIDMLNAQTEAGIAWFFQDGDLVLAVDE